MAFFSCLKSLIRLAVEAFVVILLITFIPGLPPDVNISKSWKVEKVALEGKLSPNNKLDVIEYLYKDQLHGPESFADDNGFIYASLHGGDIVKLVGKHMVPVVKFGKPCKGLYQEELCGRPLGITFGKDGYLYAADAYYGIFRVDVNTGDKIRLVSFDNEIGGRRPKLPNSVAVACNGDIYWTDSDTNFSLQDGVFSLLGDGTGRLIHYNAKTGENKVLLDNLHFANGVRLSQKEDFLLVCETNRNRIHRVYLKGPKMGTNDIFIDKLPGMPDNIKTDGYAGFIVGIIQDVHTKNPSITQVFSQFPKIRKFLVRSLGLIELVFKTINKIYPHELAQKGVHFVGHLEPVAAIPGKTAILHISENADILDCLWGNSRIVGKFSEGYIIKDHLYLGSPFNKYLGRIALSKLGWEHLRQKTDYLNRKIQICLNINNIEETVVDDFQLHSVSTEQPVIRKSTTNPNTASSTPRPTTKPTTSESITSTELPTKPAATLESVTTTSKPSLSTEGYKTISKATTTTPNPTVSNKEGHSTVPKSAAAPKPTTETAKPTTAAPKPTTTAPKPTTAAPKPTTAAPRPPTASPTTPAEAPKPSAATNKPSVTTPNSVTKSSVSPQSTSKTESPKNDAVKTNIPEKKLKKAASAQEGPKSQEDPTSPNTQKNAKLDSKEANIRSLKNEL